MSSFDTAVHDCIQNALHNKDPSAAIGEYGRVLVDECGWKVAEAESVCQRALVVILDRPLQ
jgi:hypothetical protein